MAPTCFRFFGNASCFMLQASVVVQFTIHNSHPLNRVLFLFTLKSLRSSPRFRARSRVSGRSRARLISFFVSFPNSFLLRASRSFVLQKRGWRRGSISRPSEFILTNKPIKPPWLDKLFLFFKQLAFIKLGLLI